MVMFSWPTLMSDVMFETDCSVKLLLRSKVEVCAIWIYFLLHPLHVGYGNTRLVRDD